LLATRVAGPAEARRDGEGVPLLRSAPTGATVDHGNATQVAGVGQPAQHRVELLHRPWLARGNAELHERDEPPVGARPFRVRVTALVPMGEQLGDETTVDDRLVLTTNLRDRVVLTENLRAGEPADGGLTRAKQPRERSVIVVVGGVSRPGSVRGGGAPGGTRTHGL
jgi:hypothetical protein